MIVKNIEIPTDKIADFCQRWQITEFAFFGSVLRDDFRPDSDVDILVTFAPNAHRTLFDLVDMQDELEAMFRRKVDLVSRRGIEQSRNYLRRKAILSSAEVIYVAS
ncbi:MAG TPA: nucleotidyltransferase family protein [Candidatus Sericytochromatia bacterium]